MTTWSFRSLSESFRCCHPCRSSPYFLASQREYGSVIGPAEKKAKEQTG
jgi:hypothetical protein